LGHSGGSDPGRVGLTIHMTLKHVIDSNTNRPHLAGIVIDETIFCDVEVSLSAAADCFSHFPGNPLLHSLKLTCSSLLLFVALASAARRFFCVHLVEVWSCLWRTPENTSEIISSLSAVLPQRLKPPRNATLTAALKHCATQDQICSQEPWTPWK